MNPSVSVYQLVLLWEAVLASVKFFEDSFICSFHDGWFMSTPAHTVLSAQQFWPKTAWPPCPTLPVHLIFPWATFFLVGSFPWMKKNSSKGNIFPCGRGEIKNGRSTKRHQNLFIQPWQVWLSGLRAGLQSKASLVGFPVRALAWVAVQVPSGGHVRGNYTVCFSPSLSLKNK